MRAGPNARIGVEDTGRHNGDSTIRIQPGCRAAAPATECNGKESRFRDFAGLYLLGAAQPADGVVTVERIAREGARGGGGRKGNSI